MALLVMHWQTKQDRFTQILHGDLWITIGGHRYIIPSKYIVNPLNLRLKNTKLLVGYVLRDMLALLGKSNNGGQHGDDGRSNDGNG